MSSVLTLLGDVLSDSNTLESSSDTESTNVDYSDVTCAENNVDAEKKTAASSEYVMHQMHLQTDTPAPTTSATELSLREYNEYLLNILHVLTTGGVITPATNPLKDPAAILMQALGGISPDH